MKLYGAIDLHSTNNVTVVINEQDHVVCQSSREPRVGPSCPIQPHTNRSLVSLRERTLDRCGVGNVGVAASVRGVGRG